VEEESWRVCHEVGLLRGNSYVVRLNAIIFDYPAWVENVLPTTISALFLPNCNSR
jgi:hypothetical protein